MLLSVPITASQEKIKTKLIMSHRIDSGGEQSDLYPRLFSKKKKKKTQISRS